jgi:hypothetical protein
MAGGIITAIPGFTVDATTAAVSARAGLGRPSADVELRLATPQAARGTDPLSTCASVRSFLTR